MRPIDADVFEEYLKNLHDKYTEDIEECKREGRTSGASYLNTHKELLINIMLRLKQQPTVNEWILCSERLPEKGQYVLVMYRDNRKVMKKSMFDDGWADCDGNWYDAREITAWMPLPEGYKGDEDK